MSVPAYTLRTVEVVRTERLSPSFRRITFGGDSVRDMATWGADQRVKLYLPLASQRFHALPPQDWNVAWQALDAADRPARRSYTIRAIRHQADELDIDFVLHGDSGPASAWATRAQPGDRIQIAAPNRAFSGPYVGYEWRPSPLATKVLVVGDETALPAIANIMEDAAERGVSSTVSAIVTVPDPEDSLAAGNAASTIQWLARTGDVSHDGIVGAVAALGIEGLENLCAQPVEDASDDPAGRMWDPAMDVEGEVYVWIAAEAGLVRRFRTELRKRCGLPKQATSLMGYWYSGRPFD
ncbi:MAG: siderophore-interacting protein [Pseudomonadota bacterium]